VEAPWPVKFVIIDCKSIINLSQLLQPLKHIEPLEPCLLPTGCGGNKKKICDLLLPLRGVCCPDAIRISNWSRCRQPSVRLHLIVKIFSAQPHFPHVVCGEENLLFFVY
jgi:hypothetical protein